MSHLPAPLRIAMAVVPPLLADALRALLADPRIAFWSPVELGPRPIDVLIVSSGCDTGADAPIRIELDDSVASRGGATVTTADGQVARLTDLAALRRFVGDLATDGFHRPAHTEGQRGDEAGALPRVLIDVEIAADRPQ